MREWHVFWAPIIFPEYSRSSKHISGMNWLLQREVSSLPLLPHFLPESSSIDYLCDKGPRFDLFLQIPEPQSMWPDPSSPCSPIISTVPAQKHHCPHTIASGAFLETHRRTYHERWHWTWTQYCYGNSYNPGNFGGPFKIGCLPISFNT